jgi:hypothetical protein
MINVMIKATFVPCSDWTLLLLTNSDTDKLPVNNTPGTDTGQNSCISNDGVGDFVVIAVLRAII